MPVQDWLGCAAEAAGQTPEKAPSVPARVDSMNGSEPQRGCDCQRSPGEGSQRRSVESGSCGRRVSNTHGSGTQPADTGRDDVSEPVLRLLLDELDAPVPAMQGNAGPPLPCIAETVLPFNCRLVIVLADVMSPSEEGKQNGRTVSA
eukprot:scpid108158/ scgid31370/ 